MNNFKEKEHKSTSIDLIEYDHKELDNYFKELNSKVRFSKN